MKIAFLTYILFFSSILVYAQTPAKKLGKPKETESGQVQTDTATNRTITRSQYGASEKGTVEEDSVKTANSSDSVVLDQPTPKGK